MSSPVNAPGALARGTLGPLSLLIFAVSASAPMVVLAGGITATYATTGLLGVPLSFVVLGAMVALFAVGYGAMARRVASPGPFYAFLARGLGRVWGVAGGLLALVSYNAIQISLYGLFGVTVTQVVGGGLPWWVWSVLAWGVVAFLGLRRVTLNARLIALLLVLEVAVIVVFDLGAFADPAQPGAIGEPMAPGNLFATGIGGVLALGIAAFVGVELPAVYGEEARSESAVARAVLMAVGVLCVLYTLSAWAVALAAGPVNVVNQARDPNSGLPFSLMEASYGGTFATVAQALLITSILSAMITFHNAVARYVFTLARDGVLPGVLGRIGSGAGGGAPVNGSLLQSVIAFVVVAGFTIADADPFNDLFTFLSSLAAIGVMTLMVMSSIAAFGVLRDTRENAWRRAIAPALAAVVMLAVLAVSVLNASSVLLPVIVVVAVVGGLIWGMMIRSTRPEVFEQVGVGRDNPYVALDHSLEQFRL